MEGPETLTVESILSEFLAELGPPATAEAQAALVRLAHSIHRMGGLMDRSLLRAMTRTLADGQRERLTEPEAVQRFRTNHAVARLELGLVPLRPREED